MMMNDTNNNSSEMMSDFLSDRATETIAGLDVPWRFAPRGTYHPDENPSGLISFATAENVSEPDLHVTE